MRATSLPNWSASFGSEPAEDRPGAVAVEVVTDVGVHDGGAVLVAIEPLAHRLFVGEVQLTDRRADGLGAVYHEVLDVTADRRMLHAGDLSVRFVTRPEVTHTWQRRDKGEPRQRRLAVVAPVVDRFAVVGTLHRRTAGEDELSVGRPDDDKISGLR